jgi:hypothetical protein
MCRRAWNKMIVVSVSLAAAGMLACVAALVDALAPKGSALGFAAAMVAVGAAIALVVSGYVWVCDRCEDYLSRRTNRLLDVEEKPRRETANTVKNEKRIPGEADRRDAAGQFPPPGPSTSHYVGNLRGFARPEVDFPRAVSAKKWWHGQ